MSELPDPSVVVEMEQVGEYLIIVERWRGNTWVRLRVRDAHGREVHVIEIPGEFLRGRDDGEKTKIIITLLNGEVYFELVIPETGARVSPTDALGAAFNQIAGQLVHLQVDKLEPLSHYVLVVFDPNRNQSSVCIVDASGKIIKFHVAGGRFRRAQVSGDVKEFVFEDTMGEVRTKINLRTGEIVP